MNSLQSLVKDKRSLCFEILFSLEGIVGDLVALEDNGLRSLHLRSSPIIQSIGLSQINFINKLMKIGSLYLRINCFVQKFSSDLNHYNRRLAQTIDELLIEYRNDLIEVEIDINRDSNYSPIKFNKFFKYLNVFEFLNEIVVKMENEDFYGQTLNFCNDNLFSGFTKIQKLAEIVHQKNDCLYSDIFSWIFFGVLNEKSGKSFFIEERECGRIELDSTRVPAFVSIKDAIKILKLGETVRSAQRRKANNLFGDKRDYLIEQFIEFRTNSLADKSSLTRFLESVQSVVCEENWNYIVSEEQLKDVIIELKDYYLTANDNFWSVFVTHISNIVLNGEKRFQRDLEKKFELSLRKVLNEPEVTKILSRFSIFASKENNCYSFELKYKIPVSLNTIITENSLEKYNKIMNFLVKLYSSRFQMNQIWMKTIGSKGRPRDLSNTQLKALTLRHSLSFLINCFDNYFKTAVIEILFDKFITKIDGIKDMEALQKEHQILLTQIIGQMFLKTPIIIKCIERLFQLCSDFSSCLESDESSEKKSKRLDQMIEELDRTKSQTYHLLVHTEAYKTNKLISNLVFEIEKCFK